MNRRALLSSMVVLGASTVLPGFVRAQEAKAPAAGDDARAMAAKAIAYLRTKQDKASGAWGKNDKGPTFPAITGLVLTGMLMDPGISESDPAVKAGVKFILDNQQPDGGIYDKTLPSYNTAICLSALCRLKPDPAIDASKQRARDFLKSLQFGEGAVVHEGSPESAKPVTKDDPFYGGFGYGRSGRPDMSNTGWALEALHDSGVDASDAAFKRAIVFLQRCQRIEKGAGGAAINDMAFAKGSRQGGFIYSTSENKDKIGGGQSFAGAMEETLDDGTKASRLRSYGSMTYSGFKSYIYAGLTRDDPRVHAAMGWISHNYTLEENPGVGTDGLYYYLVVFARAMSAYGQPTIAAVKSDGTTEQRNWARDLTERLAKLQNEDGSFKSVDDRWMENDPVLITAYSLIAIQHAK